MYVIHVLVINFNVIVLAVDCGRPDVFFDIRVKYLNETKTTFGTVVEYECPAGQKLTGSQLRRCQADGKWSEKCPRCVGNSQINNV